MQRSVAEQRKRANGVGRALCCFFFVIFPFYGAKMYSVISYLLHISTLDHVKKRETGNGK